MTTDRTSKPSRKERTGVDRLYKYVGARKVSFYYQYPNGSNETLASASLGDRQAIMEAERSAKRKALDIQQGKIIAGSAADLIDRFARDVAEKHYRDQSKDGIAVRKGTYGNLIKFFGKMNPMALRTLHGYQYIDARSKAGAPAKAWKELSQFSTICHYAVEWGVMERNPFVGMRKRPIEKDVRTIGRRQVIRFYLWSQRQENPVFKTMGCAALFTYLTGYRAAEVRPFHASGLTDDGVLVKNAKRKKGEAEITKLREWSRKLRVVVKRAQQAHGRERMYLFANRTGHAYTRSGWGSVWQDACWLTSGAIRKSWSIIRCISRCWTCGRQRSPRNWRTGRRMPTTSQRTPIRQQLTIFTIGARSKRHLQPNRGSHEIQKEAGSY